MANNFNFTESGYVPGLPYNFDFGPSVETYAVIKGSSNVFSSVWVWNNKMYVSNSDALTIVDLNDNKVCDYYTKDHVGRANESLNGDNIVDINVMG